MNLNELKQRSADWNKINLTAAVANPRKAAELVTKAERDWNEAYRYLMNTETMTDDPDRPSIGRPWSGHIHAVLMQLQEEITLKQNSPKWEAEYMKARIN